jgi:hypothetical protein
MRKLLPLVLMTLACSRVHEFERFDKPDEAAAFYAMKHASPPGVDLHERYATARAQMQTMPHYSTADASQWGAGALAGGHIESVGQWQFLGPGNIGGRTLSVIIDPTNDQNMYAAGISGGVWKSTNGGESWTPVGDALTNLDVSSLVIDPHDPNTIFAGTGEGYYREDIRGTNVPLRGDGIFVTHDAGETWTQLAQTASNDDFRWVNDVIMSPHDSQRLYAATRTGAWRSLDGGGTWTRVLATTVKGGCTDLVARPDTQGDTVFAACGVFEQATVYRNRNAQDDNSPWDSVLSDDGMSRTSLAIAPSNPSIIYALSASNKTGPAGTTQNLQAVYRSDQGGAAGTWTTQVSADDSDKLNRVLLSNPISAVSPQCDNKSDIGDWVPMGWHCNVIAVDPTNPDRVWAAGVDTFRSDDGGRTWGVASYWWTGNAEHAWVHADQHVILFHPQFNGSSNQTMFVANDGGVFRTDNANAAIVKGVNGACDVVSSVRWRPLNRNYGVTQFYGGAVWPDGTRFIGGAQDNGTVIGTIAGGTDQWTMVWGGDGGFPLVDPMNPKIIYVQSQNANIVRSTDDGNNFLFITPPRAGSDAYLFVAPLVMDPSNHLRLWVGGDQMWRSITPGVWTAASAMVDGKVSAIAVAPERSDRVVAGTNTGAIIRSDTATTTAFTQWASTKPRDGFVSAIQFDPFNAGTVYAAYSGFGGKHIWRSLDGGVTWSGFDGNLPDIPVHSIAIDPTLKGRIYLGTDLGVFVSLNDGATWMVESGLAPVLTEYVTIAQGDHGPSIYAFTHGRGAWRASLTAPTPRRRSVGH